MTIARRALEDALLALSGTAVPDAGNDPSLLAYGLAQRQQGATSAQWLVGRLRAARLHRLDGAATLQLANADAVNQALALIHLATNATPAPNNSDAWEDWLADNASAYRLLCAWPDPVVLVLWLRADGVCHAVQRTSLTQWLALSALHLPGTGMLHLPLNSPLQRLIALPPQHSMGVELGDPIHGRYSRQGGALGQGVLLRLQGSTIAIVGVGRIGSTLAHTLTRMGVNLLLLDPDRVELHNLDGDLLPQHEGLPKVEASERFLRPLARPGSIVDGRMLSIASAAAGTLLADASAVISCPDSDHPRLWASAWCAALLKPHLDIGTAIRQDGAEADLRLIPPGCGCLACVGGFADPDQLSAHAPSQPPTDFRQQRLGSLRSWGMAAGHLGLRMLEQMYAGQIDQAVFRRLREEPGGALRVEDLRLPDGGFDRCPLCARLYGSGSGAVRAATLSAICADVKHGWQVR